MLALQIISILIIIVEAFSPLFLLDIFENIFGNKWGFRLSCAVLPLAMIVFTINCIILYSGRI